MHPFIESFRIESHRMQCKLHLIAIVSLCLVLGVNSALAEESATPSTSLFARDVTSKGVNVESLNKATTNEARGEIEVLGLSWIKQQPRTNYTLQLMVAASPQHMVGYVRKESLLAPLALAGFKKNDKVLYLLLHGSFVSRDEADVAAKQFESAKGIRPWVRRFAALPELFDSDNAPVPVKADEVKEPLPPIEGAAWLWSRNPLHYTVQLMADGRKDKLSAFIKQYRPTGPLAIVRVGRKGEWWYLLLAGDYASEEAASKVIQELPGNLSRGHPTMRRFGAIQDQMVAANR